MTKRLLDVPAPGCLCQVTWPFLCFTVPPRTINNFTPLLLCHVYSWRALCGPIGQHQEHDVVEFLNLAKKILTHSRAHNMSTHTHTHTHTFGLPGLSIKHVQQVALKHNPPFLTACNAQKPRNGIFFYISICVQIKQIKKTICHLMSFKRRWWMCLNFGHRQANCFSLLSVFMLS